MKHLMNACNEMLLHISRYLNNLNNLNTNHNFCWTTAAKSNHFSLQFTAMVPPPNKRSKTSESSGETVVMQNRLLVPIAAKKNTELLELQPMTEEDLKLLQKKGKQSVVVFLCPYSVEPLSQTCCLHTMIPSSFRIRPVLVLLHSRSSRGCTLSQGGWLLEDLAVSV